MAQRPGNPAGRRRRAGLPATSISRARRTSPAVRMASAASRSVSLCRKRKAWSAVIGGRVGWATEKQDASAMSEPVFRFAPVQTAICTSAMRSPRSSILTWRAPPAAASCCAWKISTPRVAVRNMKTPSARIWRGLACAGRSLCGARARISTLIAPRWRNSTGWACSIRASKAAARSRECSRSAASGRTTLTARRSILDMRMRSRRQNAAPAWPRANPMPCGSTWPRR